MSEGDLAALDIDIRTPTGRSASSDRGSVAEEAKSTQRNALRHGHGGDAQWRPVMSPHAWSARGVTARGMYAVSVARVSCSDYLRPRDGDDRPQTPQADEVYGYRAVNLLNLNGLCPATAVMDALASRR